MSYYFKIISFFNDKNIYILDNNNNKNLKFRFEIGINTQDKLDNYDYGQFFVTKKNPTIDENNINIYNPFSSGFLGSIGKQINNSNYEGTIAGAITFLPETALNRISIIQSNRNKDIKNIILQSNNSTKYLSYNIDKNEFYFLEIDIVENIPPHLNCEWYIKILEKNAPNQ